MLTIGVQIRRRPTSVTREATDSRPGHHRKQTIMSAFFLFISSLYGRPPFLSLLIFKSVRISRFTHKPPLASETPCFCGVSRRKNSHLGSFFLLTESTQVRFPSEHHHRKQTIMSAFFANQYQVRKMTLYEEIFDFYDNYFNNNGILELKQYEQKRNCT